MGSLGVDEVVKMVMVEDMSLGVEEVMEEEEFRGV